MKRIVAVAMTLASFIMFVAPIQCIDAVGVPTIGIYIDDISEGQTNYEGPIIEIASVEFDTETAFGETTYILPAETVLTSLDKYIIIQPTGNYDMSVSVTDLTGTFLGETGLRVMLSTNTDHDVTMGYADLNEDNNFSSKFSNTYDAETRYYISVVTIEEYSSTTAPVGVTDFRFTFEIDSIGHYVIYNGNGGIGSTSMDGPYDDGNYVIIRDNSGGFVRDGYTFSNWNTTSDGAGTTYAAGSNVTITDDLILYAQWVQDYSPPYNPPYNPPVNPDPPSPPDDPDFPVDPDIPVDPDEPVTPGNVVVNPDGSSSETIWDEVTNADGSTTTTESTINRDQSGNIIGSTVTELTSSTVVNQTTGAVTETTIEKIMTTDKDGNESVTESTIEKVDETKVDQTTGATVETTTEKVTVKDEAGVETTTETKIETTSSTTVDEVTGAVTDKVVESVTKTDGDGNTTSTETVKETTSSSTIDEDTGTVMDTTSERVTVTNENGETSTTERTESVKDYVTEDGTEVNETVTTEKAADGSSVETVKETTVSSDGDTRVEETIVSKDPSGKVTGSTERTELSDTEEYVITTVEIHTDHNDDVVHVDSLTTVKVEGGLLDEHIATVIEHAILIDAKVDEHGATNVHSVLLDASSTGSGTLTVPTHTIDAIAGTGSDVSIRTSEGTVQMSKGVTDNLSDSESVKVSISKHTHEDFDGDRKEILRDRHIVSFGLSKDGQDVHELGGKVTASFAYQPKPGQAFSDLRVYYIDENNLTHLMDSYFDATTRQMVMDSDHFSVFFVGLLSEEGNGTGYVEPEGDDDTMLYIGVAVVIMVVIAALAIMMLRRRA